MAVQSLRFQQVTGPADEDSDTAWMYKGCTFGSPNSGGYVHMLKASPDDGTHFRIGAVHKLRAAEAFASGVKLATSGSGQVRVASSGDVVVATSLESSASGSDEVWVVLEAQRIL